MYPFEDHPQLGPCPVDAKGRERHLGPRHPFWSAVTAWYDQGKRIDEQGRCIWEKPSDPFAGMVHLGGRHWATPEVAAKLLGKLAKP